MESRSQDEIVYLYEGVCVFDTSRQAKGNKEAEGIICNTSVRSHVKLQRIKCRRLMWKLGYMCLEDASDPTQSV